MLQIQGDINNGQQLHAGFPRVPIETDIRSARVVSRCQGERGDAWQAADHLDPEEAGDQDKDAQEHV